MTLLSHWKNVQPGHFIVSSTGSKSKVLAVIGVDVIVRSTWYNYEEASETLTIQSCIKKGYLLQKGTKIVITKKDLEVMYGSPLEIID